MHESSWRALITPEEMRAFARPSAWRAARDLSLIWLQIAAAVALYALYPAWWTYAGAFVLMAGGQHGLALAAHEFAHYSIVPAQRRVNDVLGTWLFGAPVGIPFAIFRHRHFEHHRAVGTDEDPKTVYRHSVRGADLAREIARGLSGWEFVDHARLARARHARTAAAGRPGPSLAAALPPLLIAQGTVALVLTLVRGPWLYVTLWLLPLVTLAQLFQTLRAIIEHRPLEERMGSSPDSGFYGGTAGAFVRTVRANWWERLVLCKLNFGFHAEHHLWPQVSYQYLPVLRERLEEAGAFGDGRFDREESYGSALARLWRPASAREASP
jgi:fatty acid desaturase